MSPEVANRKLRLLGEYLDELKKYVGLPRAQAEISRYAIERLCQLVVEVLSDVTIHLLADRYGCSMGTYKEAFRKAGEIGLLDVDTSEALQKAAGLRNLLVHLYDKIDLDLLLSGLPILISAAEKASGELLEAAG
jgi:uncharacterized protein YutE (UPF0331/DUF86 family)